MDMTKTLVLGAGGVIGQNMLLLRPDQTYVKRTPFPLYESCDLSILSQVTGLLQKHKPTVVVNLAGQNVVDKVDSGVFDDPDYRINVGLPGWLADWCDKNDAHLIHVSTQGIFSGEDPPYGPYSRPHPITSYGFQKTLAEEIVQKHSNWTIARVTFVLGVRPFPGLGRQNPLEHMLSAPFQTQVNDRWFSPAFADDVAKQLWTLVDNPTSRRIVHVGIPVKTSRYDIAVLANPGASIRPASDDEFDGPRRPVDTTWGPSALRDSDDLESNIGRQRAFYKSVRGRGLVQRAMEVSLFLGQDYVSVAHKLGQGFHPLHAEVAADFRKANPVTDDELLNWYKETESYIWELSAYHLDEGFNYSGMCAGISEKLQAERKTDVLVLGDGIGDLTLTLKQAGLNAVYHDLQDSKTANFAQFRHQLHMGDNRPGVLWTDGWEPDFGEEQWDAVIALDYFEHLVNVEEWVRTALRGLRPGGKLIAQNAFAIGDDDHGGSIPMHLTSNNRFEHDWVPLLQNLGLMHEVSEWWIK